jgi:hypothetical protein
MLSFLFGRRKRRTVKRKSIKKPPTRLIKMCRKYKIKCTKKVGKRRVYKSVTVLKKQLKRKLKNKKTRKVRRTRRKTRFGETISDSEKALYTNAIKNEIGVKGHRYKKVSKEGKHLPGVYEVTRVFGSGDIFFFVKKLKEIKDKDGYIIKTEPIGDEIKVFVGNNNWVRVA